MKPPPVERITENHIVVGERKPLAENIISTWERKEMDTKPVKSTDKIPRIPEGTQLAEIDNERYVACWTNNDPTFQPLVILLPQWCTSTLVALSVQRQREIVDDFTHEVSVAWEKLMRAE